jgi:5-methylcytosine-specific restriction protein A
MPGRAKSICRARSCGKAIDSPGYCDKHKHVVQKQQDERRGTAHERGYDSKWTKARGFYLRKHPFCVNCLLAAGITVTDIQAVAAACMRASITPPVANVVDHITQHRLKEAIDSGDDRRIARARELFWDSAGNWAPLCKPCHDSIAQMHERNGTRKPWAKV